MKSFLLLFADYNIWAHQRLLDTTEKISEEQLHRHVESSYPSVYKTILHLWDVESVWWQRLKMKENVAWPGLNFEGNLAALGKNLLDQSKQWREWISNATDAALAHEFIYRNSKKEQFKQPVHEAIHHLFNHQTFHRGQWVTLLRQVGVTVIPATDLIVFLRKK